MTKLSASILSANLAHLGADCQRVLDAGADMIHFDVMDGHFVPNLSFGIPVLKSLHEALPRAVMDVHLMMDHPADYAPRFAGAGANIITFHVESGDDPDRTIEAICNAGCKVGLAVSPDTAIERVYPYLDRLDLVLVMSVQPGYGGQKFIEKTLEKVKALKLECARRGCNPYLEMDGGINMQEGTAAACVAAGANLLVAGSALFGAADPTAVIRDLRAL